MENMENLAIKHQKSNNFSPLNQSLSKVKPPNLAKIKSQKRADNSLELGYKLRDEAEKQNDLPSLIDADLLILSGDFESGNYVTFENLIDKKGRRFEAPHQLVALPTRLDMGYQRKSAYGNRKRIIEQFERPDIKEKIKNGELTPHFITPTYTNLFGKNLEQNFEFIEECSQEFRDSDYYGKTIKGAFKKLEFTNGKGRERKRLKIPFDYRIHGYNFHSHLMALSSVEFADTSNDCKPNCRKESCNGSHIYNYKNKRNRKLAKVWTDIVKKVHLRMFGYELEIDTKSGLCVVDVRPIDLEDKGKGIFYEASKYLAKQTSFTDLEPAELLSANKIFRNKKLIASTGIFNKKKGRAKLKKTKNLTKVQADVRLDKQPSSMFLENASSISERQSNKPLKPLSLKELGVQMCEAGKREKWLEVLPVLFKGQVIKARRKFLSRFPMAVITDLQGNCYGEHRKQYADYEKQLILTVQTRHNFGISKSSVSH
jgi:hypothetical protein